MIVEIAFTLAILCAMRLLPIGRAPPTSSLALSADAPIVTISVSMIATPSSASLSLSSNNPTVSKFVFPDSASLLLSSSAPLPSIGPNLFPNAGALALASNTPSMVIGTSIVPAVGSLTLSQATPTISVTSLYPAYAASSTLAGGSSSVTTGAIALPSGTGLFIAFVQVLTGSQTISVSGTGWNAGDTFAGSGCSCAWAWAINPAGGATFSWSGLAAAHWQTLRFSNANATTPIGAFNNNNGTGTTLSCPAITTTNDASLVLALLFGNGANLPSLPSGYSTDTSFSDSFGSDRVASELIASSGNSSDAISESIANTSWGVFTVEIKKI